MKSRNIKMQPSHPVEFLQQEIIDPYGLTLTQTAKILGIAEDTLTSVFKHQSPISPELALHIEKAFNFSKDTLLTMQVLYDRYMIWQQEDTIQVTQYQPI